MKKFYIVFLFLISLFACSKTAVVSVQKSKIKTENLQKGMTFAQVKGAIFENPQELEISSSSLSYQTTCYSFKPKEQVDWSQVLFAEFYQGKLSRWATGGSCQNFWPNGIYYR